MTERTSSVAKTRQERAPFDLYITPHKVALKICLWLKENTDKLGLRVNYILEPSAGHGDFVCAAREVWPEAFIHANEIQERLVPKEEMRQYLLAVAKAKSQAKKDKKLADAAIAAVPLPIPSLDTVAVLRGAGASNATMGNFLAVSPVFKFDLILGNPPYSQGGGAEAHVRHALEMLEPWGILSQLLKMHFRGAAERMGFWREFPFKADPPIVARPDFTGDGRDTVEYTNYVWGAPPNTGANPIHCAPAIDWRE